MPQIDVLLKFATVTAARGDPIIQRYMSPDQATFSPDLVIPNIHAWKASQDVPSIDADGTPIVTHTYLPDFYVLVSLPQAVPDLRDDTATTLAIDRDKMNARQSGMTIKTTLARPELQDIRFEPVFAGMDPPWGNWK